MDSTLVEVEPHQVEFIAPRHFVTSVHMVKKTRGIFISLAAGVFFLVATLRD